MIDMSTKLHARVQGQAVIFYLKSYTTYTAVARKLGCNP